jgi:hypothetical protein
MWPFDTGGLVLVLYVVTLALHAVFVSYVVAGTGFVLVQTLRKCDDALVHTVRDRLPFMLGCGITAGVAPLLFVQLLHQHRFYTANLLLGPRWMLVVPALVAGFYALYLAKTSDRWRKLALAAALPCFLFVAWSWSELHELMQADPEWRAFYAAGHRVFVAGTIAPRFVVAVAAMVTAFAMLAAWSADASSRKRLALAAILGRLVAAGGAVWLWRSGFDAGPARAWLVVLGAAVVVEVAGWLLVLRGGEPVIATAAGTGALLAAIVVREAPRVALIEPTHPLADGAGGIAIFAVAFVAGAAAIAWIARVARV